MIRLPRLPRLPRLLPPLRRLHSIRRAAAAIAAAVVVYACASGGGISGTSLVFGPIEGFGSIFVNGIEFDTDSALVTIEGNLADTSDLRLGMVVLVRGAVSSTTMMGIAERVAADHLLEGPVQAVNALDGTFVSLSQLIVTDERTVFDGTTLDTLSPGESVEVFGFRDADGSIRATRVELEGPFAEIELTATVSNLDTTAMTFEIGLLTVDYSAALIEDEAGLGLSEGSLVEAESDMAPVNDLMLATGVEILDPDFMAEEGDSLDVEGFVTEVISADEFVMNGAQRVLITPDTFFENGTAADILVNAFVDVEGSFDSQGTLVANEVEIVAPAPAP